MLRCRGLRFWLSRLEDFHRPRAGEMVLVKDPDEYRRILRQRRPGHEPAGPARLTRSARFELPARFGLAFCRNATS